MYFACLLQVNTTLALMTPLPAQPGHLLIWGFIALAVGLIVLFTVVLRSWRFGIGGAGWLILTGVLGASGVVANFTGTPPRIVFLFVPAFIATAVLVFSTFGARIAALPIGFLVGFQAFRIPVELLIHSAVLEGVAPEQMTWSGWNLDILSGITALLLLPFLTKLPRWCILLWNSAALFLLVWVVGVATLSFPSAFQQLKPDSIWVAWFPFIWLPTVAVTTALMGHLAVFRKFLTKLENL